MSRRQRPVNGTQTLHRNGAAKPLEYRRPPPPKSASPATSTRIPSMSSRKGIWFIGGIAAYAFTAYGTSLYRSYKLATIEGQKLDVPLDVSDRYDKIAKDFDSSVGLGEKVMGLTILRRWIGKMARGEVLEVSVGTGRNLMYYPMEKCKSITLVDTSREMIEETRRKFKELHPKYTNVRFVTQDAALPMAPPSNAGFNTIVQTMGLCSTPRPVELLKNLGTLCNKEDCQILLLEHGQSHYQWLNTILDNLAPVHANRYGCWWNRDIGKIVKESGLEVVKIKRYHLGTTWWVELRPSKEN
ncbi:hypothetical protein FGG08_004113 [Glutinoglossum americanum]|uniref:S-adenosyl-L-methionine-dependent methyltransferase n=1 Tax=Glutinoglossum americanum TaxID=1670608 RepID=A0A9P8I147_9PEZI|nr:hypothetical protein FGG08_004113 [Glutinoglossum americanum]